MRRIACCLVFFACAYPLELDAIEVEALSGADVVILGEVHDNIHHHENQARLVKGLDPSAVVFEMLTEDQAASVTPALVAKPDEMAEVLGWSSSGWPDFAMYHPIFEAAPQAAIYGGAVPRDDARRAVRDGVSVVMSETARFGLDEPLPEAEQAEREALQLSAHCDALPPEILPTMVDIQRLRDARLAQVVVEAARETGGRVVLITGNGHARSDWGVPVYLARVAPDLQVVSIGQAEDGEVSGIFDQVIDAPSVDRPDPCDAFRKSD